VSRRASISAIATLFFLVACRPTSIEKTTPSPTVLPPASATAVSVTETSTAVPITPITAPATPTLEMITSENWARLQLLKTFPAEMPLLNSAVAISMDGKQMAVGSNSRAQIFFFDLPSGQMSQSIFINGISDVDSPFEQIEYLPDGTLVANTDSPYMIYHIDSTGNVLSAWNGLGFALSADKTIMAYDEEGSIVLVEIASNSPLLSLEDASAMAFSFSPDGSKIAAENIGVDYIRTTIWDVPNKILLTSLEESANPRFSPDGRFLAVTMYDYENDKTPLKIFRPDGAAEVMTLSVGEPDDLNNRAALWSADGSVVAAQIANGPPVAWDTTNWQPLNASALQGELYSFSPDGRILITRTPDGGILLWSVIS
jgi:WD40 repeat protein